MATGAGAGPSDAARLGSVALTPVSGDRLSFGNLVGGARRLFPPALLRSEGTARLLAVADRLPLCMIERPFGFEFPLCSEAAVADFVVVDRGDISAKAYAGLVIRRFDE